MPVNIPKVSLQREGDTEGGSKIQRKSNDKKEKKKTHQRETMV